MDTVLTVAIRGVLAACARLGLDSGDLLRAAGLTAAAIEDPDARLPAPHVDALWAAAYARVNDPLLALHAAEALPFGAYKVLDFVAASSPTAGAALRRIGAYFALVDPRAAIEASGEDPVHLVLRARDLGATVPPGAQLFTFTALVTRMRLCAGDAWRPGRVDLTSPAPPDAAEHRRVFQADVRFGCPEARLSVPREAWEAPISGQNPALLSVLEDHARRLLAELPRSEGIPGRVRAILAEELPRGEPTVALVARRMAMSERTLQRRLREEGHTLAGLLDEVRTALAKTHLADPAVSPSEVAWLLGFSDQSVFTRAFRRWTGTTPGAFRAAARART
jgi:AraC-like DNA-binding protein